MQNVVVVGAQWGDEGKGKVVDLLARKLRYVVRFQGGNNAGHTLVVNGKQTILHLVPSGMLQEGSVNVIGNGVVIDPEVLVHELAMLAASGVEVTPARLVVSTEAHVIMPWHKALDLARELAAGDRKIGTTGRGIGPAYEDKVGRRGLRVADLLDPAALAAHVEAQLPGHNRRLVDWFGAEPLDAAALLADLAPLADQLRPYARSTVRLLHEAAARGEGILFEGAQGTFLDVDHGTYPFVTSSNTVAGGACAGSGVGPTAIGGVVGIAKAYCTRVGSGPFPTELDDAVGERLRAVGHEFGATTGRPRRCGWFDAAMVRHAVMVNGLTCIALTKLDVLSGMPALRICTGYAGLVDVPAGAAALDAVEPQYEEVPGWEQPLAGVQDFEALPTEARAYVARIEALLGVPVALIGTGPGRDDVIVRGAPFA
jgi:adenylosuccinate synthase